MKTVVGLGLTRDAVMVIIRRGRDLRIPRGDTFLETRDTVNMLYERECIQEERALFAKPADRDGAA